MSGNQNAVGRVTLLQWIERFLRGTVSLCRLEAKCDVVRKKSLREVRGQQKYLQEMSAKVISLLGLHMHALPRITYVQKEAERKI